MSIGAPPRPVRRPTPDHWFRQSWARSTIKLHNEVLKRPWLCEQEKEGRKEVGRAEELGLGTQGLLPRLLERWGGFLGGTSPCIASAADLPLEVSPGGQDAGS